jgi:putative MATE family efflux protein
VSNRREILKVAVPVSTEFVVILAINFVNQIIVGGLGTVAIAGVGFANSLTFIPLVVLGALGASLGILTARSFGSGSREETNATTAVALTISLVLVSIIVFIISLQPESLLQLVGASEPIAQIGATYLMVAVFALPFQVGGSVISGLYRSTGHAKIPMYITLGTATGGAVLAFMLVYGLGPAPELGVVGAGFGILTGGVIKFTLLIFLAYGPMHLVDWHTPWARRGWTTIVVPLLYLAVPLALTETFWSVGLFLYNVIFAQLGVDDLAAAQIIYTLEGVFIVASLGLAIAATALIGKSIGQGDTAAAVAWVRRIIKAGYGTGVIFGLLYMLTIPLLPTLFPNVDQSVISIAAIGILINGFFQIAKVQNMILAAGILPSGNDVKGVIIGDVSGAFVIGLPLAILLGLNTPMGIYGVFLARIIEEFAKWVIFARRMRRINWDKLASTHAPAGI